MADIEPTPIAEYDDGPLVVPHGFRSVVRALYHLDRASSHSSTIYELHSLPLQFDLSPWDWNAANNSAIQCDVRLKWQTFVGLFPTDFRSRRVVVSVASGSFDSFSDGSLILFRGNFRCSGKCKALPPTHSGTGDTFESFDQYRGDGEDVEMLESPRKAGGASLCNAILTIEMTLDNIRQGVVQWWEPLNHPKPRRNVELSMSHFVRAALFHVASSYRMTTSFLAKWFERSISEEPYFKELQTMAPHRMPVMKHFKSVWAAATSRSRLAKLPLVALDIIHQRNPSRFILFTVIPATPKTKFYAEAAMVSNFSLEAAIMFAPCNGMFLDSSFKNKAGGKTPLTMLVTVNQHNRMVPMATMVHTNAIRPAFVNFLKAFAKAVQQHARRIVAREVNHVLVLDAVEQEQFLMRCDDIAEEGWVPAFGMIDAHDGERNAIEEVFPGMPIRLCQFHLIAAVRKRFRRIFGAVTPQNQGSFLALQAFRTLQRCPVEQEFDRYYGIFRRTIHDIDDDPETWDQVDRYLQGEWLAPRWRSYCMDYGLPPWVTRDGPWSTNNFVESAFNVFDRIFLDCRANKRVDRLVDILITEYFPWYEANQHKEPRFDRIHAAAVRNGLLLWQTDSIRVVDMSIARDQGDPAYSQDHPIYVVQAQAKKLKLGSGTVGVAARTRGREICSCNKWKQTGKRCMHMFAVFKYRITGPCNEYETKIEAAMERFHFPKADLSPEPLRDFDRPYSSDGEASPDDDPLEQQWGKYVHHPKRLFDFDFDGSPVTSFPVKESRPSPRKGDLVTPKPERSESRMDVDEPDSPAETPTMSLEPPQLSDEHILALEEEERTQTERYGHIRRNKSDMGEPFGVSSGRPLNRHPNQPWRTGDPTRKHSKRYDKRLPRQMPFIPFAGATNPHGLSCYADTMHIMLYMIPRVRTRILAMTESELNQPYLFELHNMFKGWDAVEHYNQPELLDIMSNTICVYPGGPLVDDPGIQQDASEVFLRVVTYLTRSLTGIDLCEYLQVTAKSTRTCPNCQSCDGSDQVGSVSIGLVLRAPPANTKSASSQDGRLSLLDLFGLQDSIMGDSGALVCGRCNFSGPGFVMKDEIISLPTDYLVIHLSRGYDYPATFDIPSVFTEPTTQRSFGVVAIVMREHVTVSQGHFAILVCDKKSQSWWKINGTVVVQTFGPNASFGLNCYPVFLLCEARLPVPTVPDRTSVGRRPPAKRQRQDVTSSKDTVLFPTQYAQPTMESLLKLLILGNNRKAPRLIDATLRFKNLQSLTGLYKQVVSLGQRGLPHSYLDDWRKYAITDDWYSNIFINHVLRNLEACTKFTNGRPQGNPEVEIVYQASGLPNGWFVDKSLMPFHSGPWKSLPCSFLDTAGEWTKKWYVLPFQPLVGLHFCTVALHGPERLLYVLDRLPGLSSNLSKPTPMH
ncbi:hypothetical protein CC85DRAFT_267427, partial [Cutaneotrichosporon oleaginosum]